MWKKLQTFFMMIPLMAFAGLLSAFLLPWWAVAIVCLIVAFLFSIPPAKSFFSGLIGVAIIWIILAMVKDNGSNISVAWSFGQVMGGIPELLVYLVTGLTGGAVAGLGAMTGSFARHLFSENERRTTLDN